MILHFVEKPNNAKSFTEGETEEEIKSGDHKVNKCNGLPVLLLLILFFLLFLFLILLTPCLILLSVLLPFFAYISATFFALLSFSSLLFTIFLGISFSVKSWPFPDPDS